MQPALIVNANAGATRRNPTLPERLRAAAEGRAELFITHDEAELQRTAENLAAREVQQVGVVGGDGTASTTLTALWRAYGEQRLPDVAFLRGGTMNTVALSLGISWRPPVQLLKRALRSWSGHARYVERPAMQVGDRLGFLFGTGMMAGYLSEYYEQGNGHPTPITAVQVLGKSVLSAITGGGTFARICRTDDLEVHHEGGVWESRNYITVGAGTVAQVGLGFRPFYRSSEDHRRFHLLAIKGTGMQIARDLPSVWLGRGMRPETAYETTTPWAELRSSRGPFGYFVDGDLLVAGSRLRLQRGPLFRILCI